MRQVREQVGSAVQQATEIDESAARQDCPEDYKEGLLFKVKCGVSNVKSNAARVFRSDEAYDRYDFKDAREGIDKTEGGGVESYDQNKLQMPSEYPELERPPLRKVRRTRGCKKGSLKDFTPTRMHTVPKHFFVSVLAGVLPMLRCRASIVSIAIVNSAIVYCRSAQYFYRKKH